MGSSSFSLSLSLSLSFPSSLAPLWFGSVWFGRFFLFIFYFFGTSRSFQMAPRCRDVDLAPPFRPFPLDFFFHPLHHFFFGVSFLFSFSELDIYYIIYVYISIMDICCLFVCFFVCVGVVRRGCSEIAKRTTTTTTATTTTMATNERRF